MSGKNKDKKMDRFKRECTEFIRNIYKQDKIMVFGEGNLNSKLILVGEAPGEQETLKQRPFVGQAGRNLDEFLEIVNLKREDIYITNVVKFRPFKVNEETKRKSNRPPNSEEIGLFQGWLYREIDIIEAPLVVTLGNVALKVMSDKKNNIGQFHGRPLSTVIGENKRELVLFPLYHPASIIYRRELRETYIEDLKSLREYLQSFEG